MAEADAERDDEFDKSLGSKNSFPRSKDSQNTGMVKSMSSGGGLGDEGSPGAGRGQRTVAQIEHDEAALRKKLNKVEEEKKTAQRQ